MLEQLQKTMDQSVRENKVAGVNLLAVRDGRELCYLESGMADIEVGKTIRRDTIFRLYSMTKPITAAAAMVLMERGALDLGQSVADYLPGFANPMVWDQGRLRPATREIKVHDLLQMTSGLFMPDDATPYGMEAAALFRELERRKTTAPMTTLEWANALGTLPLGVDPGESWRYGTSAAVLGAVIEAASGMSFAAFLEKELFAPLDMKDTAFWVPPEKRHRLAQVYGSIPGAEGRSLVRHTQGVLGVCHEMDREPAFASGGGGLASTLDDYQHFAQMLLCGGAYGGKQLLQEQTVAYFTSGQLLERQQRAFENQFWMVGYSYGSLMRVCKAPEQANMLTRRGEYGWDGWLGCYFANFPEEQTTLLIGMQKKDAGTWELTRKLRNVFLSFL